MTMPPMLKPTQWTLAVPVTRRTTSSAAGMSCSTYSSKDQSQRKREKRRGRPEKPRPRSSMSQTS